jgi:uncharacterized protein (TIGR03089 family)
MDHAGRGHHRTVTDLLADRTRHEGHRPLLTCYDDVVGARTELSYATLDNWAAKTANLLAEEYDITPGAGVALDVDGHWTAVALILACWKLGAVPLPRADGDADRRVPTVAVVCCHERLVDRHPDGPVVVVGDGLRAEPLGAVPFRDGLLTLGTEVHAFADDYDGDVEPATPASATHDHASLLARAATWRAALGDAPRVGLTVPVDHPRVPDLLAGVLAAHGSLVAERPATGEPHWERWTTERVTVAVGDDGRAGSSATRVSWLTLDAG